MISTANGKTLLEATVYIPRVGAWHADIVVDTQSPADVTGPVTMSLLDGQAAFVGASMRASANAGAPALWYGLTRARIIGGAAGLGTQLVPQGYQSTPVGVILGDILAGAGEKLSSTSSSSTIGTIFQTWSRMAQSAGTAIAVLADKLAATWRVLPDGTIWIGTETWPASPVTDFHVLRRSTVDGRLEIGTSTPTLLPGTTFNGGNVGRVVHRLAADQFRTEVFFE